MMGNKMKIVCGALLDEDKVLIGQRLESDDICPNQWELPGGKITVPKKLNDFSKNLLNLCENQRTIFGPKHTFSVSLEQDLSIEQSIKFDFNNDQLKILSPNRFWLTFLWIKRA